MQKLGNGLLLKRMFHEGPKILVELATGDWMLGTDARHITPITSVDQIAEFAPAGVLQDVQASIDKRTAREEAARKQAEEARAKGQVPPSTVDQQLAHAFTQMSDPVKLQLLDIIRAAMGGQIQPVPAATEGVISEAVQVTDALPVFSRREVPGGWIVRDEERSPERFEPGPNAAKYRTSGGWLIQETPDGPKRFMPGPDVLAGEHAGSKQAVPTLYTCEHCGSGYEQEETWSDHEEVCKANPANAARA